MVKVDMSTQTSRSTKLFFNKVILRYTDNIFNQLLLVSFYKIYQDSSIFQLQTYYVEPIKVQLECIMQIVRRNAFRYVR
jgi:hypothetical protein